MSSQVDEARKTSKGVVVSTSMDKTISVEIQREFEHPLYVKRIRRDSTFKAHDEDEQADPGDVVKLIESRPTSKNKRWRLEEILVKQEEQALEVEDPDEKVIKEDEQDDVDQDQADDTDQDEPDETTETAENTEADTDEETADDEE